MPKRNPRNEEDLQRSRGNDAGSPALVIALSKGRVLEQLLPLLEGAGVDTQVITAKDRRLIRHDAQTGISFLLLKPDDVPTYVEYGAADLGVVGRDVLFERDYDLYAPLDLGIGRCRLVVAGPDRNWADLARMRTLRVATKFPKLTARHFAAKGMSVETIFVQSSAEIAPLTGLADVIVDLVESGETLRRHQLEELETVCEVSSVLVANRVGFKLKRNLILPLIDRLSGA